MINITIIIKFLTANIIFVCCPMYSTRLFSYSSIRFLLLSTVLTTSNILFSQETVLTYDDAIKLAVEQNITIKQQNNQLKLSQVEKQQSIASFLPSVNANGSGSTTIGRQWSNEESMMVNTSIDRLSYGIAAEMIIFNGLRNVYRLKQSNQLHISQQKQIEQSKMEIIFRTSQQFLQVLLDEELLLIAEKDFEVQKKLYEQLKAYVRAGTRTSAELLTQEARIKTSEVNLINSCFAHS